MTDLEIDRTKIWHPYASLLNPPPVQKAVSAMGPKIQLEDGTELIDSISSWWCVAHGHQHPAIVEAIRKQAEKMCHVMFAGFTHEPAIQLADALSHLLPNGLDHVFFADSGSIAVEVAVKLAIEYQRVKGRESRARLATLRGGYHGDTIGAMSLSDPDGMHTMFSGVLPRHLFLPRPTIRFSEMWNDKAFDPIVSELAPHVNDIAGVICEPIFQGANGMWMYHPEYLRKLRAFCTEHDLLLIFDEIATGFYRIGERFAMDYSGVVPDIVCVGKILTGGEISLAATVASDLVAEAMGACPLMHGPTYMANPLACAAGVASLRLFDEGNVQQEVRRIEARLNERMEPLRRISNVRDVRVLGAVGALEVSEVPSPARVWEIVRETGVWIRPYGKFIYTMPPFVVTDSEVDQIVQALEIAANG